MAVLDRASAVADLRGLRFADGMGWILWAFVHLVLIPEWENRISLSIKWIFALLSQQRASIHPAHRYAQSAHGPRCC